MNTIDNSSREHFINLVYKNINEDLIDILDEFDVTEPSNQASQDEINEYNNRKKYGGLPVRKANEIFYEKNISKPYYTPDEKTYLENKRSLIKYWIGLMYDVIKLKVTEERNRITDIELKMAEEIINHFSFAFMDKETQKPLSIEPFLTKLLYIIGKTDNLDLHQDGSEKLYLKMEELKLPDRLVKRKMSNPGNFSVVKYNRSFDKSEKQLMELCSYQKKFSDNYGNIYVERFLYPISDIHVQRAYIARNEEAHDATWVAQSIKHRMVTFDSMIITCIMSVAKNAQEILDGIERINSGKGIAANVYCEAIKNTYSHVRDNRLYYPMMWQLEEGVLSDKLLKKGTIDEIIVTGVESGQNHMTLLMGDAGVGKTMAMRYVEYLLANHFLSDGSADDKLNAINRRWIPVYIPLQDVNLTEGQTIEQIIPKYLFRRTNVSLTHLSVEEHENLVGEMLREGRFALILDGVDELPVAYKNAARSCIQNFYSNNANYSVKNLVITSDRKENSVLKEGQITYVSTAVDETVIKGFITKYIAEEEPDCGNKEERLHELRVRLKMLFPRIETAFMLSEAISIVADEEIYAEWNKRLENGEAITRIHRDTSKKYLNSLIARESAKSPDLGSDREVRVNLKNALTVFEELRQESADEKQVDEVVFTKEVENIVGDRALADDYLRHMIQMGVLRLSRNLLDDTFYSYANESIEEAMED